MGGTHTQESAPAVESDIANESVIAQGDSVALNETISMHESSIKQRDELVESLLKKADEMSSNFVKMQMKIESMQEEHKAELEKVKLESFEAGKEEGRRSASEALNSTLQGSIDQCANSIATLENASKEFAIALENIEKDLVTAAIDIAQEVIMVELAQNSSKIAATLAEELIKELQDASSVTVKVNPANHGELSKRLGSLKQVEVLSDAAISPGGVIVMSSAGNMDAQITKRFERVKKSALAQ